MALTAWELAWLDWARPIVDCINEKPAHFKWCTERIGACGYDGPGADDPTLRWPGYLGAEWRPGRGVLFIGSVHADFTGYAPQGLDRRSVPSPRDPAERARLARAMGEANRAWRDAPKDSAAAEVFLTASRRAYASLAPGWKRDWEFRLVREALGDGIEEVAWTNLAHCRVRPKALDDEYPLQRRCSSTDGAFPIGGLLGAIRPVAVLSCVQPLETSERHRYVWSGGGWDAKVFAFHGMHGTRNGENRDVWARKVAEEIAHLRKESR